MLTYGSLLIGEECCLVAAVHIGHADVVSISPVKLPEGEKQVKIENMYTQIHKYFIVYSIQLNVLNLLFNLP